MTDKYQPTTTPKIIHPSIQPLEGYLRKLSITELRDLARYFQEVSEDYIQFAEYNKNPTEPTPLCCFIERRLIESEEILVDAQSVLDYIAESIRPQYYLTTWLFRKTKADYTAEEVQECRCKWISEISKEIGRCLIDRESKEHLEDKEQANR